MQESSLCSLHSFWMMRYYLQSNNFQEYKKHPQLPENFKNSCRASATFEQTLTRSWNEHNRVFQINSSYFPYRNSGNKCVYVSSYGVENNQNLIKNISKIINIWKYLFRSSSDFEQCQDNIIDLRLQITCAKYSFSKAETSWQISFYRVSFPDELSSFHLMICRMYMIISEQYRKRMLRGEIIG